MPTPNAFSTTLRRSVVIYGPNKHRVAARWCPCLRDLSKHRWCPRGNQLPKAQALGGRVCRGTAEGGAALLPGRTRMRPPVVKRPTTPRSGVLLFFSAVFPGKVSVRARGLTSLPSPGADAVCCTTHVLRFYRQRHGDCRETWYCPLRPRNLSVPSYRPPQQEGCMSSMRQCAAGAYGGSPHHPGATIAI
jgi:hypothetical protein